MSKVLCAMYKWLIILMSLAILSACDSGGTGEVDGENVPLSIASVTNIGTQTSVSVRSTTLYTGDIGVFRLASTGYSETKSNVHYTNTGSGWSVAPGVTPVYLTKSSANLCAYYPYNADYTDGIVTLTSKEYASTADLCYQTNVSANSTAATAFALNHAYTLITFTLTRGSSYPANGKCAVSSISIANPGIASTGTLNMTTGTYIQGTTGTAVSYAPTANSATPTTFATTGIASGSPATTSVLMAPVTTAMNGNLTLTFTVDGKAMSTTLSLDTYTGLKTLAANTNYSIPITINGTALSVGTVTTTDWTDVTAGTINTVTMAKEANCYMVPLGEAVYIPVSRVVAGQIAAGNSGFTLPSAWTAGLLWTDNSNGLSASGSVANIAYNRDGGYIKVTAGCVEGNSLIAAYANDGTTVLWSWHIWTTNYRPSTSSNGTTYTLSDSVTSNVFMDRNLGATTATAGAVTTMGLLYQWGRKDPFPNATAWGSTTEPTLYGSKTSVTTTAVTATGSNLSNTIQNPVTFYYGTVANANDWYSVTASTHNDLLWGGASYGNSKTIYDPCPAGWRVPSFYKTSTSTSPWEYLAYSSSAFTYSSGGYGGSFANHGWSFLYNSSSIGYYPAAGYRYAGSGALYYVGSIGLYWSASSYSGCGFSLYFNSSGVYPASYDYRADGFSVRCVQEF
jgi:hypothetical protein